MKPVKFAYSKIANMGDLFNENIMSDVFGTKYICEPSFMKCEVTGIGSFLNFIFKNKTEKVTLKEIAKKIAFEIYAAPCYTWGTGVLDECADVKSGLARKNVEFVAVRGMLTKNEIEKITNKKINPVLGDGGILASQLLSSVPEKKYKIGLIPHFREFDSIKVEWIKKAYPGIHIIDLKKEPVSVVREIGECEVIISSSLHGLIVADSFNIPNVRIFMSDAPLGTGFKFDDYYSAYGLENPAVKINCENDIPDLNYIYDNYSITVAMVDEMKKNMYESMKYILDKLK